MHYLKRYAFFAAGTIIGLHLSFCFAQTQDTLAITTYYPAPYGVYRILRLYPANIAALDSPCSTEGEMFYHATGKQVYVCNGTVWQTFAAYWALSGSNLYPTDTAYNVGIGTTAPTTGYKLEVVGKLKAKNIFATTVTVLCSSTSTVCNTLGPAVSGDIVINFSGANFSTIPYVVCSAGPGVSTGGGCDAPEGCDAHGTLTCTVKSISQNSVTVKIGMNRYRPGGGNHFDRRPKFVNIIAMEP